MERPGDREFRIVPEDGTLAGRVVATSRFVEDLSGLGKDEEPVSEAFGNPEKFEFALVIAGLEVEGGPAAEIGRITAEIYGDVPDMAGENADEFALRMPELVVKAAENTASGKRLVVLGEGRGKAERSKGVGVEDFSEPSARIAKASGFEDFYIAQGGITDGHETRIGHCDGWENIACKRFPFWDRNSKSKSPSNRFSYRNFPK